MVKLKDFVCKSSCLALECAFQDVAKIGALWSSMAEVMSYLEADRKKIEDLEAKKVQL